MDLTKFKVEPVGHRLLVLPEEIETKTKGGIVIPQDAADRSAHAQIVGRVLAIGDQAFKDLGNSEVQIHDKSGVTVVLKDGKPWCKVGDYVLYQQYNYMRIPSTVFGQWRKEVLVNDADITGVLILEEDKDDG